MIPQQQLCRCPAQETSGLASCIPVTSPAISGLTVSHRHVLLSVTRKKTMAFIFLSQGVLRGVVCWAWKKGQLFCFCSYRRCLIHNVSVSSDEPFPSKLLLFTEGGFAAGGWALSFSPAQWHCLHPLQQSFFQCYNSCSCGHLFLATIIKGQQRNTDRSCTRPS